MSLTSSRQQYRISKKD